MEKQVRLSNLLKPVVFVFFAIFLEMVNFLWMHFTVTGNQEILQVLPKYFFLDLGVYLIVAAIMFVSNRALANIFMYFFLGLQVLVNIINATLYKVFGDIFSFDMMKLGEEAVSAFKFEFIDFWSIIVNLLILGVIIAIQVCFDRKFKTEINLNKLSKKALLVLTFFCCFSAGAIAFGVQTQTFHATDSEVRVSESDQYLWDNMQFKLEAYKKFGTFGFYIRSLSNLIYKNDHYTSEYEQSLKQKIDDGKVDENVGATLYDDNLIVIMLESFEWFAIDPFNTPTLWKIRTQSGVSMENYYSKNKTNVSEDIGLVGNMPKDTSMQYLARNDLLSTGYTLPNLFKERGYDVNFFHTYKKTFYDRDLVNKAMGFDNVYGIEDAQIENKSLHFNDWNLDSDYFLAMKDEFIPTDNQFFSFMTTVTTHGSYDRTNERFQEYYDRYDANLEEYKAWLSANTSYIYPTDKKLEKCYRQYKCAAMDTDKLVQLILQDLEDKNLVDSTSIFMYADHNCYYEDIYFNIKGTSKADYYDIYNYNVPFMIYSPKLAPKTNTTFCDTYDIYPTICSLYGLPYSTALTQGYSIYSPKIKNSVMVSYLSGAFNANFYTLNIVDMHAVEGVTQQQLDEFKVNACRFYEKQYDIELFYKYYNKKAA